MRKALAAVVTGCFVAAVAACVGGGGPLPDQGLDPSGQGGGINGGSTQSGEGTPPAATGTAVSSSSSSSGGTRPPSTITIASYDASCTLDSDCVAVFQGSACDSCKCPNAAINKKDQAKYTAALATAGVGCDPSGDACKCALPPVGCNPTTKRCGLNVSSTVFDAGG